MLLTARGLAPLPFRVTISAYFLCINLVGIVLLTAQGSFGVSQAEISAMLLPAAGGGTLAGRWLARHISIGGFRRVVLLLLVITGVIGIATALPDMLA
jgi:uncharacterized membrane protein YfcA